MNQYQAPQPAQIVLIDEIDQAALTVTPALRALGTLEYILAAMSTDYELTGPEVSNLLRCINLTARQGGTIGGDDA